MSLNHLRRAIGVAVAVGSALSSAVAQRPGLDSIPITLERVLLTAPQSHPLVLAAEARVRAARGSRVTAGAFGNPILTYQQENGPFPGGSAKPGIERETSVFGTLSLEPVWQRGSRVARARSEVTAAEADLLQASRLVTLDAARAFHRVALAQAAFAASADVLEGLDSLVRYTGARVREGATPEGDLLRLQVERDRVATEQALQEAELAQARGALLPYLATDSTSAPPMLSAVRVSDGATRASVPVSRATITALGDPLDLARHVSLERPDVLAARARAASAQSEISVQRALTIRQLGATFGTKYVGGSRTMIAGLSVPIPLFDRNRGEIERAEGERTAAAEELRWAERRAGGELAGAYEAARLLGIRVHELESGFLARAEESRRVALAAYREGAVPLLTVLDATRTLAEARLTYLRARYAEQDAVLALYAAAGRDPASALSTLPRASAP